MYLCDVVVGKRVQISGITRHHRLLARREIQNHHTLSRTYQQLIVSTVIERGDVIRVQHAIFTCIAAEGVHLRAVYLQAAVGSNP